MSAPSNFSIQCSLLWFVYSFMYEKTWAPFPVEWFHITRFGGLFRLLMAKKWFPRKIWTRVVLFGSSRALLHEYTAELHFCRMILPISVYDGPFGYFRWRKWNLRAFLHIQNTLLVSFTDRTSVCWIPSLCLKQWSLNNWEKCNTVIHEPNSHKRLVTSMVSSKDRMSV